MRVREKASPATACTSLRICRMCFPLSPVWIAVEAEKRMLAPTRDLAGRGGIDAPARPAGREIHLPEEGGEPGIAVQAGQQGIRQRQAFTSR
jgi:hypothetical protein